MFGGHRHSEAEIIDDIIPGSKGAYYIFKVIFLLALLTLTSSGALAFFFSRDSGDEENRRPVLKMAGPTLALGADGVELLKRTGGASCVAPENEGERWVFRVHPDAGQEDEGCRPAVGDLVVWVQGRVIEAFEPVHGESEVVRDAAGFATYQRRYSGTRPPRTAARR